MVSWLRAPKIVINDTINLFLTAVGILVTSNHNNFRVVFDKLLPYISREKYITGNGQPREPALCQLYRHTFVPYNYVKYCSGSSSGSSS